MTRYLLLSWQLRFCFFVGSPLWWEEGSIFVYAAGPCKRSLSWVWVPWYLRPYFTVSDLRLTFSSPPTTRSVTVEVFDPASTWASLTLKPVKVKITLRLMASQSVSLGVEPHLGLSLCRWGFFTEPLYSNGHGTDHTEINYVIVTTVS
jgi:hypothetical protein